jgi:hypothetical protein
MKRSFVYPHRAPRHPLRLMMAPQMPAPEISKQDHVSDVAFFITSFISGFIIIFGMIA